MEDEDTHTNNEIAAGYIAWALRTDRQEGGYPELPPSSPIELGDNDWASMALMSLEYDDPLRAMEIAFQIARASDDRWVLCLVGSGALETLLASDPTLLDAVSVETRSNPGLIYALGSVWQNQMPDETWAAVQRLAEQPCRLKDENP